MASMKLFFAFFLITKTIGVTWSDSASANGVELLLDVSRKSGQEILNTKQIQSTHKNYDLSDTFLATLYVAYRGLSLDKPVIKNWFEQLFDGNYHRALKNISKIKREGQQLRQIAELTELYLLWKLQLPQTFINYWIELAGQYPFYQNQLGISLDQTLGADLGQWLLAHSIHLSSAQIEQLKKIESAQSVLNYSLQGFKDRRAGTRALNWLTVLPAKDALRPYLIQTILLGYARSGELGKAASLVKTEWEPYLKAHGNSEDIAKYYMVLGRMLYQANAFAAAKEYYLKIPKKSSIFLQARAELMWVLYELKDYSSLIGEIKSFDLPIYKDKFLPEKYFISSLVHLKTCSFNEVKMDFDKFINENKKWAQLFANQTQSHSGHPLSSEDIFISELLASQKSVKKELDQLHELKIKHLYEQSLLETQISQIQRLKRERERFWNSKTALLSQIVKKMKFTKVETLGKIYEMQQRRLQGNPDVRTDHVQTTLAKNLKQGDLVFPFANDGFPDEAFYLQGEVSDGCIALKMAN